ncbi:uncharacterized protein [Rutidosis leptorrhynchoides]|uniref:uncharacterized protein n=1 Tax=Rutidosis leptorrhynchoides TaxID=125765 RepID=UPI003A998713
MNGSFHLRAKNLSLLSKWWWRYKLEPNALWRKVIHSLYGEDGGLGLNSDERRFSPTWKQINKCGLEIDKMGIPFTASISRKVGNGNELLFWFDKWLPNLNYNLKGLFLRLFTLENTKDATVSERVNNSSCGLEGNWCWSSRIRGRLCSELQELEALLSAATHLSTLLDSWKWDLSTTGKFSVKRLSSLCDHVMLGSNLVPGSLSSCWVPSIPKKVNIFIWKICMNRILTLHNLEFRGVALLTVGCPLCDRVDEDVEHLFSNCSLSNPIWRGFISWWGITSPLPSGILNIINSPCFKLGYDDLNKLCLAA